MFPFQDGQMIPNLMNELKDMCLLQLNMIQLKKFICNMLLDEEFFFMWGELLDDMM